MGTAEIIVSFRSLVLFLSFLIGVVFFVTYFPQTWDDRPVRNDKDRPLSFEEWLDEELAREEEESR